MEYEYAILESLSSIKTKLWAIQMLESEGEFEKCVCIT